MNSDTENKNCPCLWARLSSFCSQNQNWLLPLIIFVLALLIRLIYWYVNPYLSRDACDYITITENLHATGHYGEMGTTHPMVPIGLFELVNLLMFCGFSAHAAGVGVNLVMGALVPVFTYAIAQKIFLQKKIAVFSAFLICFNPSMIKLSVEFQRDMIYLALSGCLLWLLCLYIKRKKIFYCIAAGCIFAFACLTRYEALEFLILFLSVDFAFVIQHKITLKHGGKSLGVFLISAVMTGLVFTTCTNTFSIMKDIYIRYLNEKVDLIKKISTLKSNV